MVSCAACGCSRTAKNKTLGITFHAIPKDIRTRKAWINFVTKPEWKPKGTSYLCSQHFTKDCFDLSSRVKVRLLPTALPTIEVSRLKYVRTFNPVHTKIININNGVSSLSNDVLTTASDDDVLAISGPSVVSVQDVDDDIRVVPGPYRSIRTPSSIIPVIPIPAIPIPAPVSLKVLSQDTLSLKMEISRLHQTDILKSQKIRKLQKIAWRQKKQISSLKSVIVQLKKQNLMLEHENILLEH